jgi:hypothetical protein
VFTASGTLPPCQFRVLIPKDTACEKLSWPRRIPDSRAKVVVLVICIILVLQQLLTEFGNIVGHRGEEIVKEVLEALLGEFWYMESEMHQTGDPSFNSPQSRMTKKPSTKPLSAQSSVGGFLVYFS